MGLDSVAMVSAATDDEMRACGVKPFHMRRIRAAAAAAP
eukprot:gene32152-49424_t